MSVHRPASSKGRRRRGVDSLGDIVDRWVEQNRVKQRVDPASLFGRWKDVVGERIAARTRVVDLRAGELIVEVGSAALLGELSTYYRQEILDSLAATDEFRGVRSIRFRSGSL